MSCELSCKTLENLGIPWWKVLLPLSTMHWYFSPLWTQVQSNPHPPHNFTLNPHLHTQAVQWSKVETKICDYLLVNSAWALTNLNKTWIWINRMIDLFFESPRWCLELQDTKKIPLNAALQGDLNSMRRKHFPISGWDCNQCNCDSRFLCFHSNLRNSSVSEYQERPVMQISLLNLLPKVNQKNLNGSPLHKGYSDIFMFKTNLSKIPHYFI